MLTEGMLELAPVGIVIVALMVVAYVIIMILLPIYVASISKRVKQINMKFDRIIEMFESDFRDRKRPDKFTI